jgi:hypothetical protein
LVQGIRFAFWWPVFLHDETPGENLTHSARCSLDFAWGGGGGVRHLTRARIRAPSDGEITSLKTTRHSNTIDNVKAKIDNVKAKIQDKEERRP